MGGGDLALLERSALLDVLARGFEAAARGSGRLVAFGGEAGVGKTTLVRWFCAERPAGRVLWGACERLFTPPALGPFLDIAETAGGELGLLVGRGATPHEYVGALVAELRRESPTVLVVEDLHWADEGTLDVLKLLARRIERLPVLAVASFRDDQLSPVDRLQIVLGELAGAPGVERHHIPPFSLAAVRTLAASSGADPERLFTKTAGNPFFVTEALAAMDVDIPDTVRDAVLARAAHLDPAPRRLLEAAAVITSRLEVRLLEAVAGDDVGHLQTCLRSGMLRDDGGLIAFRHELARLAIEEAIAPDRRLELHRAALRALSAPSATPVDPAVLSHHADAARDAQAVLRYAPAAGERAAALQAHRQAAQQFERALRYADGLAPDRRAHLFERRSYECYLTDQVDEAIHARRAALALHRAGGDRVREGDSHRWLSRLAWFAGDNAAAREESRCAIALLESQRPGRELAMAYSNAAQLSMLADDSRAAAATGAQAIALAEGLGETEILVHALNNVGTAELGQGVPAGVEKLERSLALALDAGLEEHVARAYTNLGSGAVRDHQYALADTNLADGIAYCDEHDLDSWGLYMIGWDARSCLDQGRWDRAAERAEAVLRHPNVAAPSRITPLIALGVLRARRGDDDPWTPLDEALELAQRTGELQRLAPVAAARAEAAWLQGAARIVAATTDAALALARDRADVWMIGELCTWRRRAGIEDAIDLDAVAAPFARELAGDWSGAAKQWTQLGCPYEAALAQAQSDDEASLRRALGAFQALGAVPAARATTQRLRKLGATAIGRGPHRSTVQNPGQLTARQLEILQLLGDRLTNAQIAARLYISPKTVDHHVSAILAKLGVHSRTQAAAEAVRLGLA